MLQTERASEVADDRPAPFFCVPGIGGNLLNLQALALRLGPSHRLVGLRTGLATSQKRSVEDLAAEVAAAVLKHPRRGALMLGGYSGGAAIAFEVARQLSAAGHEVGMLVLIDTRRPGWRMTARTLPPTAWRFVANLPGWVRDDLLQSSRQQAWRNVRRHLRQAMRGRHTLEGIIDTSRYSAEARLAMQREFDLLEAYRPLPWSGPVTLIRAQTQPLLLLHDEAALGWSAAAPCGVDVVTLPGNHLTIMREPNVARLADVLRARMSASGLPQPKQDGLHRGVRQTSARATVKESIAAE